MSLNLPIDLPNIPFFNLAEPVTDTKSSQATSNTTTSQPAPSGINLYDDNEQPVNNCNVIDENRNRYYIQDKDSYKRHLRSRDISRNITMVSAVLLMIFLCIFTMNFASSSWTAGNMLTFGIVVITLLVTVNFAKTWNENNTLIKTIQSSGIPCLTQKNSKNVIHCGV